MVKSNICLLLQMKLVRLRVVNDLSNVIQPARSTTRFLALCAF